MLQKEFETLAGYKVTENEFKVINNFYMSNDEITKQEVVEITKNSDFFKKLHIECSLSYVQELTKSLLKDICAFEEHIKRNQSCIVSNMFSKSACKYFAEDIKSFKKDLALMKSEYKRIWEEWGFTAKI